MIGAMTGVLSDTASELGVGHHQHVSPEPLLFHGRTEGHQSLS